MSSIAAGLDVVVERGAGEPSGYPDALYTDAGATVVATVNPKDVEVLAHVRPLPIDLAKSLPAGRDHRRPRVACL